MVTLILKFFIKSINVSTRSKRALAMSIVIGLLERILAAEVAYMDATSEDMLDGDEYISADYSAETIVEVIDNLSDAY
jgi:hypothetical protein